MILPYFTGHLARAGGTLTSDFVEFEVKRALEWLQGTARRLVVPLLTNTARNPTFNPLYSRFCLLLSTGDRSEQRRHAAVLVLKELAEHAPTLFNVHVSSFLDHVWVALRDPKLVLYTAEMLCS